MELVIMTGNIGSGKGLIAAKYAKNGYVVVNMDTIQTMIGGGEYGLYDTQKKDIYHHTEMAVIESALSNGFDVVVDRTNMDRKRRAKFIQFGDAFNAKIISIDFGPGDFNSLQRRIKASYGIPSGRWANVSLNMAENYEKPSFEEGFDELFEAPTKYKFHAFDFDGTIVEHRFPEIGPVKPVTVEKMVHLWEDFSNIIIIWTCRGGDYENQMRDFLLKNKIPFDFINENPMADFASRKIFAHEYHDDRNAVEKVK